MLQNLEILLEFKNHLNDYFLAYFCIIAPPMIKLIDHSYISHLPHVNNHEHIDNLLNIGIINFYHGYSLPNVLTDLLNF